MTARNEPAELLALGFQSFENFCGLLQIQPKGGGGRLPFVLTKIQRDFCRQRTQRDVVLKCRQAKFTSVEAARDVYHFLTVPGARVTVVAQSVTGGAPVKDVSDKVRVMFESLRSFGLELNFSTSTATEWVLPERDALLRIIVAGASEASAAKKGRAGTISRLHLTETAFYDYAGDTLNAILECVPPLQFGSEIVSESTPNGVGGVFFGQYQSAVHLESDYKAHFYPWFWVEDYVTALAPGEVIAPHNEKQRLLVERVGLTPQQLKWMQHKIADKGEDKFSQEFASDPETCFLVSGRTFFDAAITGALLDRTIPPIATEMAGFLRIWKRPTQGCQYVVVADPSEGIGGDPGAAVVFDRQTGEHVATLHGQMPPWRMGELLVQVARLYGEAWIVVERNNHGHAVLQSLEYAHKYRKIFKDRDDRYGWMSTEQSRSAALDALESAHRLGTYTTPDREVVAEMMRFVVNKNGKAEAGSGAHDDLVMCTAIGFAVLTKPTARTNRDLSHLPSA